MKNSFANELRNFLMQAGADGMDLHTIQEKMDAVSTADKRKVNSALRELRRYGEVEVDDLKDGKSITHIYRYLGKQTPAIKDKMWTILRARKTVSVEDLQELTGAGREYAAEWLRMLARQEVVVKAENGQFRLVKDPVIQPENVDKNERLRRIRASKKELMDKMDMAMKSLLDVRLAIADLDSMAEVAHE